MREIYTGFLSPSCILSCVSCLNLELELVCLFWRFHSCPGRLCYRNFRFYFFSNTNPLKIQFTLALQTDTLNYFLAPFTGFHKEIFACQISQWSLGSPLDSAILSCWIFQLSSCVCFRVDCCLFILKQMCFSSFIAFRGHQTKACFREDVLRHKA